MNNIEKEIQRRNKRKERKTYKFKNLEAKYIIFYPLMVIVYCYEWIENKNFERIAWSEERTKRILDYAFPKFASINENGKTVSYWFDNYMFCWCNKVRFYDKRYCRKFNNKISDYLFNHYEIDSYNKKIINEYEFTNIVFTKN